MIRNVFTALLPSLGAAVATAGTAHATVFAGTGTFSDNGPTSNGILFTGVTDNAALGSVDITMGNPVTLNDFLSITSHDNNYSGKKQTDTISEAFAFTLPSAGSGTVDGTAKETVEYFIGFVDATGKVTWNNPGTITFDDGAILNVSLSSAKFDVSGFFANPDQTVGIDATFTLVQDASAVPEPMSFELFGLGMLGVGMIRRRDWAA